MKTTLHLVSDGCSERSLDRIERDRDRDRERDPFPTWFRLNDVDDDLGSKIITSSSSSSLKRLIFRVCGCSRIGDCWNSAPSDEFEDMLDTESRLRLLRLCGDFAGPGDVFLLSAMRFADAT